MESEVIKLQMEKTYNTFKETGHAQTEEQK